MYIKLENNIPKPYSLAQLRKDNPQTSFPDKPSDEFLAQNGVFPVVKVSVSNYDKLTHFLKESTPYLVDGKWHIQHVPEKLPLSQAEKNIKIERDRLLSETDWVVVKAMETQTEIAKEWSTYRQELRDITFQANFPYDVKWPNKP